MNKNALDAIETASIDELRSVQFERMQKHCVTPTKTVQRTKKFDEAGVHPDDFKQLEDLAKFPFTTKRPT